MVRIFAEQDGDHRLEGTDGAAVGWVRGRGIGLRGFVDERRAVGAVAVAWRALDRMLRRQHPGWPRRELVVERLRIVADGADEWIVDGGARLARLIHVADAPAAAPLAIELELPSFAGEGAAVAAAPFVAEAVRLHTDWIGGGDAGAGSEAPSLPAA